MGFSQEDAEELHTSYYRQYGLAIRGLVKHHQIDPFDFDKKCDASLPLESLLKPDISIRQLLLDIDRSKVSVWAATNAYIVHAERVLKILNLRDQFEGIVFCDYADPEFTCKPEPEYFKLAMTKASLDPSNPQDLAKCHFVDDSLSNVRGSKSFGWKSSVWFREKLTDEQRAHLISKDEAALALKNPGGAYGEILKNSAAGGDAGDTAGVDAVISDLQQLREVWPHLFKEGESAGASTSTGEGSSGDGTVAATAS